MVMAKFSATQNSRYIVNRLDIEGIKSIILKQDTSKKATYKGVYGEVPVVIFIERRRSDAAVVFHVFLGTKATNKDLLFSGRALDGKIEVVPSVFDGHRLGDGHLCK